MSKHRFHQTQEITNNRRVISQSPEPTSTNKLKLKTTLSKQSVIGGARITTQSQKSNKSQSLIKALQQEMTTRQNNYNSFNQKISMSEFNHKLQRTENYDQSSGKVPQNMMSRYMRDDQKFKTRAGKNSSSIDFNTNITDRVSQISGNYHTTRAGDMISYDNQRQMLQNIDEKTFKAMHVNPPISKPKKYMEDDGSSRLIETDKQKFMNTMTNTNLDKRFDVHDRFCLCCNDHQRHESIKYKYPKMIKSAYLNNFRKSVGDGQAQNKKEKDDFNINKISRNLFASTVEAKGQVGQPTSKAMYQKPGSQNYQVNTRFPLDPKDGRSKTSFVHLSDIQPFMDTTTNKATFPFWPANVAKQLPENQDQNGLQVNNAIKSNTKTYDTTHYKETFIDPKNKDIQLEAQYSPNYLRQMFKSYSSFQVQNTPKFDGTTTQMLQFKHPSRENYKKTPIHINQDSMQGMNVVHAPKEFYQPTTQMEYAEKKPQLVCNQRSNFRQRQLFYK
ncbi:UNKNOWN [Stylonychia lemnae]|uniref:Uncharacterized protein n=1 Tax=Stylonychia lemnae TaxID=5949 RepID=A0A077ZPQ2_STYLE|nr:UNKNOWN [Stylonychia lemnae]|eukprot:CDW71350.1 UNKNOWN [Stylonychia lemnae]